MKTGRPKSEKKGINIADIKDDMVQLHVKVPDELRIKIKQRSLDERRTVQEILLEIIDREFK